MTDSESFSSLMALVDSHLSKTGLQAGPDVDGRRFQLPSLTGGANETSSDTRLQFHASPTVPLPTLGMADSPIQEVLAKQVSNMLKAKEKKLKEDEEAARLAREREKLEDEMRKLKMDDDCVIDLVKAVKESKNVVLPTLKPKEETMSGSCEALFIGCEEPEKVKTPEPLLPCKTDMSYILKEKVRRGRCSAFGKVLTSRLRPVAAPYLVDDKPQSKVVRFDFTTKSPCDIIKEKLKQPRPYVSHPCDIFKMFPELEPL